MGGYYRKFCPNCSTITSSFTNWLRKAVKLSWTESGQFVFDNITDFSKEFKVDASDVHVGVDAVLLQEGKDKIDLPICYFSTNLTPQLKKSVLSYCCKKMPTQHVGLEQSEPHHHLIEN